MKKILSLILAILTICSFATVAFAYENVDNTFDNFTPGVGKTAPDNWYDPYCYDADGHILPETMDKMHGVRYCSAVRKVYAASFVAETIDGKKYHPYQTTREKYITNKFEQIPTLTTCYYDYCPYCGLINDGIEAEDIKIKQAVVYGCYCENCGGFNGYNQYSSVYHNFCINCNTQNSPESKLYRFIKDEYRNQEYSWLFEETADKYGDGIDGSVEDLEVCDMGGYYGWKNGPQTPEKPLTIWQRIIKSIMKVFNSIKNIFTNLF